MSAGLAGQLTSVVIIVAVLLYNLGLFRGFRFGWRARDTRGGAVRIDVPPMRVVRGSYRSKKTPVAFPVPAHHDHDDAV